MISPAPPTTRDGRFSIQASASLFDDERDARREAVRLQELNGAKGSVYFVERVKKYSRGSSSGE